MIQLALELGNTFTTIAYKGYGIVFREPTLVAVRENNGTYSVIAYGTEAAELQGKTDESTTIFSPVSSNRIISQEYAELYLRYCLDKTKKLLGSSKKLGILFCQSVSFDAESRQAYEQLAMALNLHEFLFAPSVLLAAHVMQPSIDSSPAQMIVDLGGGKCDLALVKDGELIKGVSVFVGGKQMDLQIMRLLEQKYNIAIGTLVAKQLKDELATLFSNDSASMTVIGKALDNSQLKKVVVTSSDIYPAIEDYFEKIASAIALFFGAIPAEYAADVAKQGISMIGGLAGVPNVKPYLMQKQKNKIIVPENYDTIVMEGAENVLKNTRLLAALSNAF